MHSTVNNGAVITVVRTDTCGNATIKSQESKQNEAQSAQTESSLCTLCLHACQVREVMYFVFSCLPGGSYCKWLRSLLVYLCDVFQTPINSHMCGFYQSQGSELSMKSMPDFTAIYAEQNVQVPVQYFTMLYAE